MQEPVEPPEIDPNSLADQQRQLTANNAKNQEDEGTWDSAKFELWGIIARELARELFHVYRILVGLMHLCSNIYTVRPFFISLNFLLDMNGERYPGLQ